MMVMVSQSIFNAPKTIFQCVKFMDFQANVQIVKPHIFYLQEDALKIILDAFYLIQ